MNDDAALRSWLTRHARPLDVGALADSLADASVVGLAPTTREAQEVADVQADLVLALVERGTSTILLQDTTEVAGRLDAWLHDDTTEDLAAIQAEMWGPWQIQAVTRMLHRVREHQRAHPGLALEVRGIRRATATVADYRVVIDAMAGHRQSAAVTELLTTIRVAHDGGEHVERAHGRWDGPPFVELATAARELTAAALTSDPGRDEVLLRLDRIVDFHATSLSQGHAGSDDERLAAEQLLAHLASTGRRAIVWDGIGHLAGVGPAFGATLRDSLRGGYRCVFTTFGEGTIRDLVLPPPLEDSLEASLDAVASSLGQSLMADLRPAGRGAGSDLLASSHRVRLVSGMYASEEDERHYVVLDQLTRAVDAVVHVPRVTPAGSPR